MKKKAFKFKGKYFPKTRDFLRDSLLIVSSIIKPVYFEHFVRKPFCKGRPESMDINPSINFENIYY